MIENLALGLGQIAGDLGDVLFVGDAVLLQGFALGLGPFVQGQDLAAFFLEMLGQLFFLAFEGGLALHQADFFLAEGDLLGGHGGGLQPQSVLFAGGVGSTLALALTLGHLVGNGEAARRQVETKLKPADRQQIAVLER